MNRNRIPNYRHPCKRRKQLVLRRVLYVTDADVNMLSCSKLDLVGTPTVIEDQKCILLDRQSMCSKIESASRRKSDLLFLLNRIVFKHPSASAH